MPRIEATEVAAGKFLPVVTVTVRTPSGELQGPAVIDSGADVTVLPSEPFDAIGIPFTSMAVVPQPSRGAGGAFDVRLFSGRLSFRQWAIRDDVLVAEPGALADFGLLGRDDFFKKFRVRFNWSGNPPWVQIDPIDLGMQAKAGAQPPRKRKRRRG